MEQKRKKFRKIQWYTIPYIHLTPKQLIIVYNIVASYISSFHFGSEDKRLLLMYFSKFLVLLFSLLFQMKAYRYINRKFEIDFHFYLAEFYKFLKVSYVIM